MQPFRFHVFLCDQNKPEDLPCCSARGSAQLLETLRREVAARGLSAEVQVTPCGSLGLCEHGPNLVIYPEGSWYSGVTPADIPEIVHSHFQNNTPVARLLRTDPAALKTEITTNRDKMLAALRARDAAGILPDDLNDKLRGFQTSRILLTALELDLFTATAAGAPAAAVAATLQTDPRATEMLLNALVSLGLLRKQGDTFHNQPAAARYFQSGSPDNARPALLHTAHLWHRWSHLTACVKAGTAVPESPATARTDAGDDWTEAFIAAMHRNASERAPLVVRAIHPHNAARLLDVGGGSGAYSIAFAQANPTLTADLLDRPEVLPIAQRHIDAAGLTARIHPRPGDLRTDPLGHHYDLVFLSAICHMLSPAENQDLLQRCHQALAPGGRLVIQDFILDASKTAPRFAALFSINMLTGTAGGASYSEPEYAAWLQQAGFQDIRRESLPGITALMLGTKP
jgi:(2Fe-2S) ferredoxin/SAM-dependent methyltransferase